MRPPQDAAEGVANATLAVELVTEELPPKSLKALGAAFADTLAAALARRGLLGAGTRTSGYATPRRLAVVITDVRAVAPDVDVVDKLMPAKVAFDAQGQPSLALQKKLAGLGRAHLATAAPEARDGPDHRYTASDGKADYVFLKSVAKGQPLARALQEALDETIARLPIAKVMRYPAPGSYYSDVAFVRPAHRLLALHGTTTVPVRVLGLDAGNVTSGHRFLARDDLVVRSADAYAPTLEAEGKVVPDFAARRATIVDELIRAASGATVIMPDPLVDEVTALVEWPVV
ncbi:MAG: glycine--tRNA ligase subunit beta, partial [Betaproteobacteria bacterium]